MLTKEELNEIFKATAREMQSENLAAKITERAMKSATSVETPANLVSIATIASIEYSQELLFRVLARVLKDS